MGNMYHGVCQDKIPGYTVSASIPMKKQSLVTTNAEKKGFSSQAKRFPVQICLNQNPGPGSHSCTMSTEIKSPSFSQKGTTGFVPSKPPRGYSDPQRGIPGPNVYNTQSSFIKKNDFNVGVSRVFRLPVAVQVDGPKNNTPAPNEYDVTCVGRERLRAVVGTSGFFSKTGRYSFWPKKNVPSPCHYEVNNHFIQHSSKAVLSPFRSKTQRIPAPADNHVPGPGAYSPHQTRAPMKKTVPPRGCYLALSAPPLIVPKDPPLPGPGQYDIGKNYSSSKHSMPTAAFASRTDRIPPISQVDSNPGPGFYNPKLQSKQSHFYNDSRVWVSV